MKKTLGIIFVVFLIVSSFGTACAETFIESPKDIENAALSVVLLKIFDGENKLVSTGSGFLMFDNMTLITNYHVIENAAMIKCESDDGYEYCISDAKVVDKDKDIAILKFMAPTVMQPLEYSVESLMRGQNVVAIGSPVGLKNSVSTGIISYVFTEDNIDWIQISAPVSHGSSGGALFNENGQVIGITTATRSDGQNLNFAININEVVDLYNQWDGKTVPVLDLLRNSAASKKSPAKTTVRPSTTASPTPKIEEKKRSNGKWAIIKEGEERIYHLRDDCPRITEDKKQYLKDISAFFLTKNDISENYRVCQYCNLHYVEDVEVGTLKFIP